jgi:hypothetical protein
MMMIMSLIQRTCGVIQGAFVAIQGTFGVIQMMMIFSPFGQLGLWAPSSGIEMYSHKPRVLSHTTLLGNIWQRLGNIWQHLENIWQRLGNIWQRVRNTWHTPVSEESELFLVGI